MFKREGTSNRINVVSRSHTAVATFMDVASNGNKRAVFEC